MLHSTYPMRQSLVRPSTRLAKLSTHVAIFSQDLLGKSRSFHLAPFHARARSAPSIPRRWASAPPPRARPGPRLKSKLRRPSSMPPTCRAWRICWARAWSCTSDLARLPETPPPAASRSCGCVRRCQDKRIREGRLGAITILPIPIRPTFIACHSTLDRLLGMTPPAGLQMGCGFAEAPFLTFLSRGVRVRLCSVRRSGRLPGQRVR